MRLQNTEESYGPIAIFQHWVMALLIIAMLALGLYMTGLPIGLSKLKYYGWHKALGVLILGLVALRLLWRAINITPSLASLPPWEKVAARGTHAAFYVLMVLLPLTGWMMSSAAGLPVSFFGWFVLPDLVSPNDDLFKLLRESHGWLAYAMIALICLHVAASLKHHFIDKDDILRRML